MVSIITNSLIALLAVSSISQMFEFCSSYKKFGFKRMRYIVLCLALALECGCNIAMFAFYGKSSCYTFYAFSRFARALFLAEIILVSEDIIRMPKKTVSLMVSYISYGSVFLYLVETLLSGGILKKTQYGVFLEPQLIIHQLVYSLFYIILIVCLLSIIVMRASYVHKRRDKYELFLIFGAFGSCCCGILAEFLILAYSVPYFPVSTICNIVAVIFTQKLVIYHRSLMLCEEDYEKELMPNRKDPVFILDDTDKVVFINSRAQILSGIFHEEYLGRKFTEIFDMSDEKIKELRSTEDQAPFGMSSNYPPAERSVNMVVRHSYDRYGEIFSSCIVVYNMEDREQYSDVTGFESNLTEEEKQEIADSVSLIRGARILIVDEDLIFLREFQSILKTYDVTVSKALNGEEALYAVKNEVYDMVFISDKLITVSAFDLPVKMRSVPGEYFSQMPIILVTEKNINDMYAEFLNAGYTDYLYRPISLRQINSVLTRWIWQRRVQETDDTLDMEGSRKKEMETLLEDAGRFVSRDEYDKLLYCINALKRIGRIAGLSRVSETALEIEEACIFKENGQVKDLLEKLTECVNADS